MLAALALAAAASTPMGALKFPVTGNKACNQHFLEGMLALHSFMYEKAHEAFAAAAKADAGCAMAHWGDAMAYSHPLWGDEDMPAARAALAAVKDESKLTPKERAFLGAARALWGDGPLDARQKAWLAEADRMRRDYPGDDEVALEDALALITNADRNRNTRRLAQAAAIAMDVFARNPAHPGAAHYLIHACDTPDLAILALPAARAYAKIAPAAAHALHMPSHTFVHLGMWREAAASNEASWAASEADYAKKKTNDGDRDWHSYAWLFAAYLEQGEVKRAEKLLTDLRELLAKSDYPGMRFAYSQLLQEFLTVTGRDADIAAWLAPLAKPLPLEAGEAAGSVGCAMHAPGGGKDVRPPFGLYAGIRAATLRAELAARAGDEAGAKSALAARTALVAAVEKWGSLSPPKFAQRQALLDPALLAIARATKAATPAAWAEAADAWGKYADAARSPPAGPPFDPPVDLVLGELLAKAGKPKESLAAYDAALAAAPGSSTVLLGAARAAKAAGELPRAHDLFATLAAQWAHADEGVPGLAEVRAGAAEQHADR